MRKLLACLSLTCLYLCALAQNPADTTDIMDMLEKEAAAKQPQYATATFKTTRLINGHSVENVGKGVLDVKISHRFGTLNRGAYELFGLDNATMRMGLDYGITNNIMIGFGRSTFEKTYDGFVKVRLLRQSSGARSIPVTVSYVGTIAINGMRWADTSRKNFFSSRMSYTHQLLIARKFSEGTSLQLMPTFIHRNLAVRKDDPNGLFAIGIGGRQKLSKRVSVNAEYYYLLPGSKLENRSNTLSLGFDIETGGHVFQLHFTNSRAMTEKNFISENTCTWGNGDIHFGFNISRVFNIGKRKAG